MDQKDQKKRSIDQVGDHEENEQNKRIALIYKEPSIFNVRPMDDITKIIYDFIWKHCQEEHVEIEAKLGVFIDKRTSQRINWNSKTETGIKKE